MSTDMPSDMSVDVVKVYRMTTLNTNTRPLRRNSDLSWSAGSKKPCEFCSISSSCESAHAETVTTCSDTVPFLAFQDETGLSHLANTFRLGRAWEARLRIGDRIGLYNTLTETVFGYARVIHVSAGAIGRVLKDHAHANHLMLSRPHNEAPRELVTWLRKNYGPRLVNTETKLTAIYLLREPEKAPQAPADGSEM